MKPQDKNGNTNGDSAKIEGTKTLTMDDFRSDAIRDFYIKTDYFGEDDDGYIYDPDTMEYVDEGYIEDEMNFQRGKVQELVE